MAVFFFVIGLEIKRELDTGELRDPRAATLPALAAVGGMVVPAVLYVALAGGGEAGRGWGIPMATDIAFVLGVLAVLGRRVPSRLKLFLLTLAIIDDIGAIVVIAVFYSGGVHLGWLASAALAFIGVWLLRVGGVSRPIAYLPLAVVAWVCTLESGVHATIAGVALGLLTPARPVAGRAVLTDLEHRLHPWSSFLVVPVFALANAGVALGADQVGEAAASTVSWAVVVGLVVGKTVGVAGMTAIAVRLRIARLPQGLTARHVVGGGTLAGVGFTVSLFVTGLAFDSTDLIDQAKVGILVASVVAGALGTAVLVIGPRRPTGSTTASKVGISR